jgi:hypothetical protein
LNFRDKLDEFDAKKKSNLAKKISDKNKEVFNLIYSTVFTLDAWNKFQWTNQEMLGMGTYEPTTFFTEKLYYIKSPLKKDIFCHEEPDEKFPFHKYLTYYDDDGAYGKGAIQFKKGAVCVTGTYLENHEKHTVVLQPEKDLFFRMVGLPALPENTIQALLQGLQVYGGIEILCFTDRQFQGNEYQGYHINQPNRQSICKNGFQSDKIYMLVYLLDNHYFSLYHPDQQVVFEKCRELLDNVR